MNEVRKGKVVVLDGAPYVVASAEFLRKQQRKPVMRTILKDLRTGATREHSFQQSDKIEEADIENRECQFLYQADGRFTFMDQGTYEQLEIDADIVGQNAQYLLEGQKATIVLFQGQPVGVELPIKIERRVIESPPGVRGDTSTNVTKDAVIEGDTKVKVPLFINEGDSIRIDTRTGEYVERV